MDEDMENTMDYKYLLHYNEMGDFEPNDIKRISIYTKFSNFARIQTWWDIQKGEFDKHTDTFNCEIGFRGVNKDDFIEGLRILMKMDKHYRIYIEFKNEDVIVFDSEYIIRELSGEETEG